MQVTDDVKQLLDEILDVREGGKYTNRPADRGGPTRWGVTLATLSDYLGRQATVEEVRNLERATAFDVYLQLFVTRPRFDAVADPVLRDMLIDAGVQHGQRQAAKWIQTAVRVTADGTLGPVSLAAINAARPVTLFVSLAASRLRLYGKLVAGDPALKAAKVAGFNLQAENAGGWCNRIADLLEKAT